ncbi:MAG: hypothetical protein ACK5X3_05585 [Pseudomonadota bacterium]
MTDIVKWLREVNSETNPYVNQVVKGWCYEAADEIERLRRERDEAREALRAMNDFLEKIQQATTDFLVPDGMTQHAYINEIIDLQDRALAAIRQLKDRTP